MKLKILLLGIILSGFLLVAYSFPLSVFAQPDITSSWSVEETLPEYLASHTSFVLENEIFVVGGANSLDYSSIWRANFSEGDLSTWVQAGALPQSRYWASGVGKDSHVYQIGGASLQISGLYTDSTLLGEREDGGIGSWTEQAPLPQKLGLGAAVISGNNIYFSGGFNSVETSNKVYKATIGVGGSVEEWVEVSSMPIALFGHGMVEDNGNLYIIGGYAGGSQDKVYRAIVSSDGSLSSWSEESLLPKGLYRPGIIKVGKTIFSVGGDNNGISIDRIYFTQIGSDGSLGPWQESSHRLPAGVHGGAVSLVNEYLYLIGGYRSGIGYLNSVYYTKLDIEAETMLNVPLFMQTDPTWGSHIYDSANIWSSATPTISAWGCAMTSAVMVFRYQGITKLPDGQDLNPGTLNTWLKSQSDGYVNTGWVNWLALSRLSKLAKSQNPDFTSDALEYKRNHGYSPEQLTQDIEADIPGILEVPGHFIVGKGVSGNTFKINDPYYADRVDLTSYSDTFSSLGRFVPSNTDLSYLMFIIEDGATITVKDKNGDSIGEGFTQQSIDEDGGGSKNGSQFFMYYVPKPTDGTYSVEVKAFTQMPYSLQIYAYDQDGEVKKYEQNGIAGSTGDLFEISYKKQNLKKTSVKVKSTFENLLSDIEYFYLNKQIKSKTVYLLMKQTVSRARGAQSKAIAKGLMASFLVILETNKKYLISSEAHSILKPQAVSILSSL